MQKKFITLAVAAALAAPMAAQADATMYGRVRLGLESADFGAGSMVRLQNYNSYLGMKGSEDLGGDLKAVYQMEFGVDIAGSANEFGGVGNAAVDRNVLSGRNTFVGLAGGWGTFVAGRHDTPLKISTAKLDYFADTAGDADDSAAGIMGGHGLHDRRADGTVAYISPAMGGLTVAAALVPGENTVTGADGLADAYSVAAMYSNAGFYGSLAYEAGSDVDALAAIPATDLAQWRLGLGYDGGEFKVAAVYEDTQVDNGAATVLDQNAWMINGAYNFGNSTVKLAYRSSDVGAADASGWAIGFDHNLSKRTQVYGLYTTADLGAADVDVFGVGLNHSF